MIITNSKSYLRFWLSLALGSFSLFAFSFFLSKLNSLEERKNSLKQTIKLESLLLENQLNKKLGVLKSHIKQVKKEGFIPPESPLLKFILLQEDQIEKIYLDSSSKIKEESSALTTVKNSDKAKELKTDPLKEIHLSRLKKSALEVPLDKALKDKTKIYFTKTKENDNSYLVGLSFLDKNRTEIMFFKRNIEFFKLDPSKNTNIYVTAVTDQNQTVFYNKILKKRQRSQVLQSLLKTGSPKYITIKSSKNSGVNFYYLYKWKPTNLYLISQFKNSDFISKTVYSAERKYFWILTVSLIVFCLSLFVIWRYLSSLSSAYTFLKSAFISFSKDRLFPLPPFKNPLLYFYNNRLAILNKKESLKESPNNGAKSFQDLIRSEIKQLKKLYPNLKAVEDFQSNVKIFGTERFLKTVLHELLLNGLESMGAKEEQKMVLSLKEEKNNLIFSVQDYGSGLKEEEKAFQMYYSTKSQLGVGLNLVQSIVKAKGGAIELKTLKEGGAKALMSLPLKIFLKEY